MNKYVLLIIILGITCNATAQKQRTSQDSIKVFYDAIFNKLKEGYINKDTVNWQMVESQTIENLRKYTNFKTSLNELIPLFSKIGATHCAVQYDEVKYSVPARLSPESFSDDWQKKYQSNPDFETKVIDGKYGYILMPALFFADTRQKNVNKVSQRLYNQIADLKDKNKLEGWIIDLRVNSGGNSWPMLLALYDFLGDNDVSATLDNNKRQIAMASLSKGNYLSNGEKQFWIKPTGKLLEKTKVAVITGVVTASSGEVVAMAFKGRANTIFIGEKTMGFTSANYGAELPFNATFIITKAYNSDRNGNYYDYITPDITISKQDNFEDLLLDGNIIEAVKFIDNQL